MCCCCCEDMGGGFTGDESFSVSCCIERSQWGCAVGGLLDESVLLRHPDTMAGSENWSSSDPFPALLVCCCDMLSPHEAAEEKMNNCNVRLYLYVMYNHRL